MNILVAVVLTVASGLLDAQGFIHASRTWKDDAFVWREAAWASLYFSGGVATYVLVIRFLNRLGVAAPELQALIWFGVAVIGVAVIQRTVVDWPTADRLVALVAVLSVGWLVVRQG